MFSFKSYLLFLIFAMSFSVFAGNGQDVFEENKREETDELVNEYTNNSSGVENNNDLNESLASDNLMCLKQGYYNYCSIKRANNEKVPKLKGKFLMPKKDIECTIDKDIIDHTLAALNIKKRTSGSTEDLHKDIVADDFKDVDCNSFSISTSGYDPNAKKELEEKADMAHKNSQKSESTVSDDQMVEYTDEYLQELFNKHGTKLAKTCYELFGDGSQIKEASLTNGVLSGATNRFGGESELTTPDRLTTPLNCMSGGDSKRFKNTDNFELFLDPTYSIVDNMDDLTKQNLCIGIALYNDSKYKVNSCANILAQAPSCPPETDQNGQGATQSSCKDEIWKKYSSCLALKSSQATPEDMENLSKIASIEASRQFGVCQVFRDVSLDAQKNKRWEKAEKITSIDGRFECLNLAPWTLDYKDCKGLINAYNGIAIANEGRTVANSAWAMVESRKIQNEAADEMSEGNQVTAGLSAQEKAYLLKRDQERGNLGFFGAKTGTLTTLVMSYATPKKVSRKCDRHKGDQKGAHYCAIIRAWEYDQRLKDEIFPNQEIRKQMLTEIISSASQATLAALRQAQFNKMAQDTKKLKDGFKELTDESKKTETQVSLDFCKFNPTAATCRKRGPRVTQSGGFSYGSISNQGSTGGTYGLNQNNDAFGEYDEDGNLTAGQRNAIEDLNNMMDNEGTSEFDNSFNKVGTGSFSKKSLGGGGGGGGGVGGGGGGGGGGAASQGKAGPANYAITKSKGKYAAGSKASFSAGSSLGSKKSDSKNPFSDMFGSKSGRNVASKIENDIAPAHSQLFEKISSRYSKVNADNRLINLDNIKK